MGWNAKSAARAGLLHDLSTTIGATLNLTKVMPMFILVSLPVMQQKLLPFLILSTTASSNICGATIAPPRYKESWVVTLADDYVAMTEGVETARFKWKTRKYFKRHLPI